jgi:hypothetical protein
MCKSKPPRAGHLLFITFHSRASHYQLHWMIFGGDRRFTVVFVAPTRATCPSDQKPTVKNSRVRHVRRGRVQRLSRRQTRSREAIFAERSTDTSVDSATDAVQHLSQPPRARLRGSRQHTTDVFVMTDICRLATIRRGPVTTLSRWSVRRVRCLSDGRVCRVEPRHAHATDAATVPHTASVAVTFPRLSHPRAHAELGFGVKRHTPRLSPASRASVARFFVMLHRKLVSLDPPFHL